MTRSFNPLEEIMLLELSLRCSKEACNIDMDTEYRVGSKPNAVQA